MDLFKLRKKDTGTRFKKPVQSQQNTMKTKNKIGTDVILASSQLTFICSKTPIETLEKGVKYVQS